MYLAEKVRTALPRMCGQTPSAPPDGALPSATSKQLAWQGTTALTLPLRLHLMGTIVKTAGRGKHQPCFAPGPGLSSRTSDGCPATYPLNQGEAEFEFGTQRFRNQERRVKSTACPEVSPLELEPRSEVPLWHCDSKSIIGWEEDYHEGGSTVRELCFGYIQVFLI